MHSTSRVAWALLLLVGCSAETGDPRDAWIGFYHGTLIRTATDCTSFDERPSSADITVEIVAVGDHLAVNGACLMEFDLVDDTGGVARSITCDSTLSDGRPVTFATTTGSLELDGDRLVMDLSGSTTTADSCENTSDRFSGLRR